MTRNIDINISVFSIIVVFAFLFASCHNEPIVIYPLAIFNIEVSKSDAASGVTSKSEVSVFNADVSIVYEDDTVVWHCTFCRKPDSDVYVLDNTCRYNIHASLAKIFHVEVLADFDGEQLFGSSEDLIIESPNEAVIVTIELGTNGYDYVDLGLPSHILWATCNLGASSPEEPGNYYAWGETETKKKYNGATYTVFENLDSLDALHDAAKVNMGGNWHIPTMADFEELTTYCTVQWTSLNDVNGCLLTGPNGNTIFFPASGGIGNEDVHDKNICGIYWLSPIYSGDMTYAWGILLDVDRFKKTSYIRYYGQTIRPACYRNRR